MFRVTVLNEKTQRSQAYYSGRKLIEEALSSVMKRVEEETPIGELPLSYSIRVEIIPDGYRPDASPTNG